MKVSRATLAVLLASLLALLLGLILSSDIPFYFGALIGLVLSIWLVRDAIRQGGLGSDVLALISIVVTSLTQEWLAASIISLMLASGRALESWASGRARSELESLVQRTPRTISLVDGSGATSEAEIKMAKIGDRFLVRSGEVVALDGILESESNFDESALTGEPIPNRRLAGQEVPSGVVNLGAPVVLRATTTSESSTYAALVRLVQKAQASAAPGVRIANRWAAWFVPFSLGLAGLTWFLTGETSAAIAVLVAATPCPLILATPIAIIGGISRAASRGAIIKDGGALEALARCQVLLVDKTGTLTLGGPALTRVQTAPNHSADDVLRVAASIEQSSSHVLAKTVVAAANFRALALPPASNVEEILGEGVVGSVLGKAIRIGRLVEPAPAWVEVTTGIQICVDEDGQVIGVLDLEDPIRTDAAETVKTLRKLGLKRILLVTGDRKPAADAVGKAVGVDQVFAESRPKDKLLVVSAEQAKSPGRVLFVGDGINDAPALAAADVGVAMGARGASAASETADVVIIEDSISRLSDAIQIAQGARNRALQAAGIGMALSILAMFAGAFGWVSVTQNALLQEVIDAVAICLALIPSRLIRSSV